MTKLHSNYYEQKSKDKSLLRYVVIRYNKTILGNKLREIFMNKKLVANHFAYLRKQHALTQEELAEELGVSRQAVSHWECGEAIPDVEVLLNMSKLYGVSVNQILEPDTIVGKLECFEDLHNISEKEISYLRENVLNEIFVKAYMGTSPENAKWMEENMKDIDFPAERDKIGRVRISDVENAQNEIVNLVNLYS